VTLLADWDPATERPTAVVTANNFLGFGLIDAARQLRLRVPHDLAVVTFDDVEIVAGEPFFTCAAQPAEALGRTAVELLIERLNGDESPVRDIILESEIRIRSSCGCSPLGQSSFLIQPLGGAVGVDHTVNP
jgi:LacI family transcriptional regulator